MGRTWGRKLAVYVGGLIALYLVVDHWQGTTKVEGASASGLSGIFKTLQGR